MALDALVDSSALDAAMTATAGAIRTKGGTSAPIPWSASTGFKDAIDALPSGGGEPTVENDVNFYDYDGTLIAAYSAADFADLAAMPDNPTHTGLTAQGWNWTLADAQSYVAVYGGLDIGQMYVTEDGKTRLYCYFSKGRTHPYLTINLNGTLSVDWGDNSPSETLTGNNLNTGYSLDHVYATEGDYVITITPITGTFGFSGTTSNSFVLRKATDINGNQNRVYLNTIQKVEIGTGFNFRGNAFRYCGSIKSINIPSYISTINPAALLGCSSLNTVVVPLGCSFSDYAHFYECSNLKHMLIPEGISELPQTFLRACKTLERLYFPSATTSGNGAFYDCSLLKKIVLPTTMTNISNEMFRGCANLASIVIPISVTTIGSSAFYTCEGLGEIHFKPTTPPTVANANAFTNLPTDCKIYVPAGTLSDYTSAANYPDSTTYTYIEE